MKSIRLLGAVMALAAAALLSACASPPGADVSAQLVLELQTARAAVDLLAASHHVDATKVAAVRAQADAAIALLASVGPIASMADPKLAPAMTALAGLNGVIAKANAPAPASSSPS